MGSGQSDRHSLVIIVGLNSFEQTQFPSPKDDCAKFGSNWPNGSRKENETGKKLEQ